MTSCLIPASLAALPLELLQCILPLLSRYDLAQCVRVCRAWKSALIPFLWHTIGPLSDARLAQFFTKEAQQALSRNAIFVRELHLGADERYNWLLPSSSLYPLYSWIATPNAARSTTIRFSNLHSLELHPRNNTGKFHRGLVALVRQNHGIRRLRVRYPMTPKVLMSLVSQHLPNLEDFSMTAPALWRKKGLQASYFWHGDVKMLLENLPENIQSVRLRNVCHAPLHMVGAITSYSGITRVRSHQALESLEIDGNLRRLEVGSLAPFLMSCSDKLQSVEGLEAKFWAHPKIGEALQMIGYASKVLRSDSLDPSISMTDLIKMIAQGSPWTRIQLDTSMMTKGVADAIVRHSAGNHLEAVEILHRGRSDSGPGMQGYHMQEILHRSPRLKTFLAHWLVDDVISDRDILSSEWATRSLEHIDLKIAVFRPFDCAPIHVHMHSYDIQRQVLRRIGQQKKLRKLVIGGMTIGYFKKRIYRQFECLEMNLESGLDELADLKELVELDISEMNHRVRVPDLEWMARNFPSLERLSMGMSDRPLPADVTEWLRRHRPGWASY